MSEEQQITPWNIDGALGEWYVPLYIENMADEVLCHYNFTTTTRTVMALKNEFGGLIWKLETDDGPKSLKILHRPPVRSLFSIAAQEYLVKKGAKVPEVIKTKQGESFVNKGEKLWFVAEWIDPLWQVSDDLNGAKLLSGAIADFHERSKGFVPPERCVKSSRLKRWPKKYAKIITKMNWFREITELYGEMPASQVIQESLPIFEIQAVNAHEKLLSSPYRKLADRGDKAWGLAHQDYGSSNGQQSSDGMWIIDLDGVAFDLPVRDMRKLIDEYMYNLGYWDLEWVMGMLEAYDEVNPIEDELFEVLLIDMSHPNLFYKHVKEMVYEPEAFLDAEVKAEVERVLQLEETKWAVIAELRKEWKGGKRR
ncbi:CotS family spore coat protein [Evansella clarkii]|uniref:CotS family spore coat protein n=1 Tax=Evansella clarkii TaxID=79879 RepID=UPI0009985E7D|nr:CotS family spore coat protein [Evansella clarkii]